MKRIYNVIDYMEDELFLSILVRTARENGLANVSMLITEFLCPEKSGHYQTPSWDANELMSSYAESADVSDPVLFYIRHTMYPGLAPLMDRARQNKLVNLAFRGRERFPGILTKQTASLQEIRYCRECMRDDAVENGFVWIHRKHQMPGVKVCSSHGTPLYVMTGSVRDIFADDYKFNEVSYKPGEADMAYAVFAEDFLKAEIEADITVLWRAVLSKIREDGFLSSDRYESIRAAIKERKMDTLFSTDVGESVSNGKPLQGADMLALLMFLFGDVDTLIKYIKPDTTRSLRFLDRIDGKEYELYDPYRENIVLMHHISCDTDFVTTPDGFANGWRCPKCDWVSEEEKAAELIRLTGNGEYEPLEPFKSMNTKMLLRHSCGRDVKIKPRSFLEEGQRCECESRMDFEKAQDFVKERTGGEYELLEYSGTEKPAKLRHLVCGGEFRLDRFRTFMRHQRCPLCKPVVRTHESFEKEIRDLVGDEYTLTGKYTDKDTYVKIRHNICGREQEYMPRHFLRGMRCPYCDRMMTEQRLGETLETVSCGRYTLKERKTYNLYIVHDNKTNRSLKPLTADQIMQELNRPTPSKIMLLDQKMSMETFTNVRDRVYSCARQNADGNGLFFRSDLENAGFLNWEIDGSLRTLLREENICRIAEGVYSLENRNYDAETLIYAKYIERNGRRIGFYGYEDLAYEFGIIDHKPDTLHIVTNLESYKTAGRMAEAFGIKFRIIGPPAVIMSENYKILEVLHLIAASHHYGWKYQSRIKEFLQENGIRELDFLLYVGLYPERVQKQLHKIYEEMRI